MKYSNEYKRMCIEMYYQGEYPETPEWLSEEEFHHTIRKWVRVSEKAGLEAIDHKEQTRKWTAEEKLELVEKVLTGRSIRAVADEEGMNSGQLYSWVRIYRMEGYKGLVNKPKGRAPKEPRRMKKKKEEPRELTESEREELLRLRAENEYLRAETAAIKKLMALRREKEEARLKARKQKRSGNSGSKDTE
ncbi:MAG: helix-turn-helix domain-containing protein [Bacteroidales bacterium]|nr:helix-turn-helix domain-containing protein [Bacteroidales bacterium]